MTNARQELYDLAGSNSTSPEGTPSAPVKDEVKSAINEYFVQQQQAQQDAEMKERQRQLEEQRLAEEQEKQKVAERVRQTLQEEVTSDKSFGEVIKNSDLPGAIVEYIAEVGEPDEASLMVRELANNDEYRDKLQRVRTSQGVRNVLKQVRRTVLMGGQKQFPKYAQKNVANYAGQKVGSQDSGFYADLRLRQGI